MRPRAYLIFTVLLLNAFPDLAEAAKAGPGLREGDRVLVTGSRHRKCSARIESLPAPGFAVLQFDRSGCGDASVPYDLRHLQRISFQDRSGELAQGDSVVVKGNFGNDCSGRIHEISRAGYVSVDLDSLLCADGAALFRAQDLTKVQFVTSAPDNKFAVGQRVSTSGIHEGDECRGEIRKLTDNGLAEIAFEELTCAYGGKLYPLDDLRSAAPAVRHHASGDQIFRRVMREISSLKDGRKKKPHAHR